MQTTPEGHYEPMKDPDARELFMLEYDRDWGSRGSRRVHTWYRSKYMNPGQRKKFIEEKLRFEPNPSAITWRRLPLDAESIQRNIAV